MQEYIEKVATKSFTAGSSKEAYLKACKWLAKYVISNPDITNMTRYHIKKRIEKGQTFVDVVLYVSMNKDEADNKHCAICRENHNSFLLNDNVHCADCKLQAYHMRELNMIGTKVKFFRERIVKGGKENGK